MQASLTTSIIRTRPQRNQHHHITNQGRRIPPQNTAPLPGTSHACHERPSSPAIPHESDPSGAARHARSSRRPTGTPGPPVRRAWVAVFRPGRPRRSAAAASADVCCQMAMPDAAAGRQVMDFDRQWCSRCCPQADPGVRFGEARVEKVASFRFYLA